MVDLGLKGKKQRKQEGLAADEEGGEREESPQAHLLAAADWRLPASFGRGKAPQE